mgnify:CR=1 FL=1|tara:strand:- start:431 stop:628 length:198 start_codon:yes stop_codon:yes gene_type:complete
MRLIDVGDLVEILEDGEPTGRSGVVLTVEVAFDRSCLVDRRVLHITGMARPIPDSDVRLIEIESV